MVVISQTTTSNTFSWMKIFKFRINVTEVWSQGSINNIPALVQIMAWRRQGEKPLSEPVIVWLLAHLCIARPQWVKWCIYASLGFHELTYLPLVPYIYIYMRQRTWSALVEVMTCRMFGTYMQYVNQCWCIANWTLSDNIQWKSNQNTKLLIHESALVNVVWEMAAILSRVRWVTRSILHIVSEAELPWSSMSTSLKKDPWKCMRERVNSSKHIDADAYTSVSCVITGSRNSLSP